MLKCGVPDHYLRFPDSSAQYKDGLCLGGKACWAAEDSLLRTGVPAPSDKITSGSMDASIENSKIAWLGDACAHGGKLVLVQDVSWLAFERRRSHASGTIAGYTRYRR